MNIDRLYEILRSTTREYRKGAEVEKREVGPLDVTEVYMMPPVEEATPGLELIDVEFMKIGVDKEAAEKHRAALVDILDHWPNPAELAGGPSYIAVGGTIGDQGAAFCLFALGQVLGLWKLITPASMGFTGAEARDMAGSGFIMITGYRAKAAA